MCFEFFRRRLCRPKPGRVRVSINIVTRNAIIGADMLTLQNDAKIPLTVSFLDQLGKAAPDPSTPEWAIDNSAVATLDASSGDTVNLVAVADGTAKVTVTAGSLTAELDVTVAPPTATTATITVGTPVAK